jgi:transcriptional antiterminator NusG
MKKPLSNEELENIRVNTEAGKKAKKVTIDYEVLESVKIINGPFENFIGSIDEIYNESAKVKVVVNIFGRDTPVNLAFSQIEKIN